MPFLGKQPTAGFASIIKDDFTPNGSTTAFTLSKQVANANDIAVFVGNVRQEPTDAYTVNGTTLTMSAAPASGLNFYVLHIAGTLESSVIPADNTISSGKLTSNAVTTAKIANSAITDAKITGMAASKLTGAMPALDGSSLTGVGGKTEVISYSHTGASNVANIEIDLPTDVKYRSLRLVITDWYGSAVADLYARFRRSGQSSIDTSANYHWIMTASHHGTTNANRRSSNGDSKARLVWYGCGNALAEAGVFTIDFFEHNSTKKTIAMHKRWGSDSNNDVTTDTGGFRFNYNEAVDRIQLYHSSGTITYGTYTLYGILRD